MTKAESGAEPTKAVPSAYSAANPPRGFRPGPFPFHYHLNIVIVDLGDMGWGRGLLADESDRDTKQPPLEGQPSDIARAEEASAAVDLSSVPEGWEVRVPLVMPGELVRVRIFKNFHSENPEQTAGYSEADLVEILRPSPERIQPRCPLAGSCGGCQFQHMKIDRQREWKTEYVRKGLEAQRIRGYTPDASAKFISIREKLFPTAGTDEIFEYRNKITPHYQAPVKMGDDEYELKAIGFQQVSCRDIIDVEECPIATPAINATYKETRKELHEKALKGLLNNKKRRKRNRRSKSVDLGATLLFREADPDPDTGKPVVVTEFKEFMTTTVKGIKFRYMAGNFFQNNNYVVPLMVDAVIAAALAPGPNGRVPSYFLDCYCGSGLFALTASKKFKLCVGIEVNDLAVEEATQNAEMNSIGNCQFVAASAEAIFTSPPALTIEGFENQKIQEFPRDETVVVLDPPRKGCSGIFLEQLYEYAPQRIVYMSCGPSTQARDAKGIVEVGGYEIISIQPFDLFPQTKHVECLMVFEKKKQE
jgi:tRNA/tmRNA/rRNA uracil-C5-methylase (TrmA/RlmC/RlmD family)